MPASVSLGKISIDTAIDFAGYRSDRSKLLADLQKLSEEAARSMSKAISNGLADGIKASKFGYALRQEVATGTAGLDVTFQRNLSRGIKGLGGQVRAEIDAGLGGITIKPQIQVSAPASVTAPIPTTGLGGAVVPDNLGGVIVGSILKANLATAIAGGLIGGVQSAIEGSVNLLKASASMVLGDVTGGIRQELAQASLASQVQSQAQLEGQTIAGASAIEATGGTSFTQGKEILDRMRLQLSKDAARLPGNTADYVRVLNGIQDDLIAAYRDKDTRKFENPAQIAAFEKMATTLSKNATVLSVSSGIDPRTTIMGMQRALSGLGSNKELSRLDFFQKQPQIMAEIERLQKKAGVKSFSALDEESRANLLNDALSKFNTPDRLEASQNSFDGIYQTAKAKLFDESMGAFSIGRKLGDGTTAFDSIKATFKDLVGDTGFFAELSKQAQAAGLKVGDPMVMLKSAIDGIDNTVKSATAGMQAFFQTDFGKGLIEVVNAAGAGLAAIPGIISNIITAAAPMAESLAGGLGAIVAGIQQYQPMLEALFSQGVANASALIEAIAPAIGQVCPIIELIFVTLFDFIGKAGDVLQGLFDKALPVISSLIENVLPQAVAFVAGLFPLLESIGSVLLTIFTVASEAFLGVLGNPIVQEALKIILEVLTQVVGYLVDSFNWIAQQHDAWMVVLAIVAGILAPIVVQLVGTVALITLGIIGAIEAVKIVLAVLGFVINALKTVWEWVSTAIPNAIKSVIDLWNKLVSGISDAIQKNSILKAGFDAIKPVINGLTEAWKGFIEWIEKALSPVTALGSKIQQIIGAITGANNSQLASGQQGGTAAPGTYSKGTYSKIFGGSGASSNDVGGGFLAEGGAGLGAEAGANAERVAQIMRSRGIPEPVIAAALVNAVAESGLNANAVGDGGHSIGIFQLNDNGAGYGMTVESRKNVDRNTEAILADQGVKAVLDAHKSGVTSISELAALWSKHVERPGDEAGAMRDRAALAKQYFPSDSVQVQSNEAGAVQGGNYAIVPTGTLAAQEYGASRSGGSRSHAGQDLDLGDNDSFQSYIGGRVTAMGDDPGGYFKWIDVYNDRLQKVERIAELDSLSVNVGDTVAPGQVVGKGTTATGVVHYEIRTDFNAQGQGGFGAAGTIDPIKYLEGLGLIKRQGNQLVPTGKVNQGANVHSPDDGHDHGERKETQSEALKRIGLAGKGAISINEKPVAGTESITPSSSEASGKYKKGNQGLLQEELTRIAQRSDQVKQARKTEDEKLKADRDTRDKALSAQLSFFYKPEDADQKRQIETRQKLNKEEDRFGDEFKKLDREIEDLERLKKEKQLKIKKAEADGKKAGFPFKVEDATPDELKEYGISTIDYTAEIAEKKKLREQKEKTRKDTFAPLVNEEKKTAYEQVESNRKLITERLTQDEQFGETSVYRKEILATQKLEIDYAESAKKLKAEIGKTRASLVSKNITKEDRQKLEQQLPDLEKQLAEMPDSQQQSIEARQRNFIEAQKKRYDDLMRSGNDFVSGQNSKTVDSDFVKQTETLSVSYRDQSKALRDYLRELQESSKLEGLTTEQKKDLAERIEGVYAQQERLNQAYSKGNEFLALQLELDKRRETNKLQKQISGDIASGLEAQAKAVENFNPQGAIDLRRQAAGMGVQSSVQEKLIEVDQTAANRRKMLTTADGRSQLEQVGLGSEEAIEQSRLAQRETIRQQTINDLEEIKNKLPTIAEELRKQTRDAFADGLKKGIRGFIDGKGFDWKNMLKGMSDVFLNKGIDMLTLFATNSMFGDGKRNQGLLGGLFSGGLGKNDPMIDSAQQAQLLIDEGGKSAGQKLIEAALESARIMSEITISNASQITPANLASSGFDGNTSSMGALSLLNQNFNSRIEPAPTGSALVNLSPTSFSGGSAFNPDGAFSVDNTTKIGGQIAASFTSQASENQQVGQSIGSGFLNQTQSGLPGILQSVLGLFGGASGKEKGKSGGVDFMGLLQTGIKIFAASQGGGAGTGGMGGLDIDLATSLFAYGGEARIGDSSSLMPSITSALKKEEWLSGHKPFLAALHDGEHVLTRPEAEVYRSIGGISGLIPNFADGGPVGLVSAPAGGNVYESLTAAASTAIARQSQPSNTSYKFEYQKIGEQEVVSVAQLKDMEARLNQKNDPRLGAQYALDLLRSNLSARRQAGF